jgi:hypothetical protein
MELRAFGKKVTEHEVLFLLDVSGKPKLLTFPGCGNTFAKKLRGE